MAAMFVLLLGLIGCVGGFYLARSSLAQPAARDKIDRPNLSMFSASGQVIERRLDDVEPFYQPQDEEEIRVAGSTETTFDPEEERHWFRWPWHFGGLTFGFPPFGGAPSDRESHASGPSGFAGFPGNGWNDGGENHGPRGQSGGPNHGGWKPGGHPQHPGSNGGDNSFDPPYPDDGGPQASGPDDQSEFGPGDSSEHHDGTTLEPVPVPEPSALVLILGGLLGLRRLRRR